MTSDDSFGPWASSPTRNRWDEVKIGQSSEWYDLISRALGGNIEAKTEKSTTKRPDTTSRRPAERGKGGSQIPVPTRGRAAAASRRETVQSESLTGVQTIDSPRGPIVERTVTTEDASIGFISVKYEPCDGWRDPHIFNAFLESPQYQLQPWPSRAVSLDDAMDGVKKFFSPKAPVEKDGPGAKRRRGRA